MSPDPIHRAVPFSRLARLVLAGAACAVLAVPEALADARMGGEVDVTGPVAEDLYVAASRVLLQAAVEGDALLAAGSVDMAGDVTGDVFAAGGNVTVDGGVGDDLRIAGGNVTLKGFVTDHAVIAGGTVTLTPESAIAGRAWISGGDVTIAGQLGHGLEAMGGTVRISGQIEGDVEVAARELQVEPGAVIGGNLIWRGEGEPLISEDAQIYGDVVTGTPEAPVNPLGEPEERFRIGGALVAALAVFLATAGLWWLAPALVTRSGELLRRSPFRLLLQGLLVLLLVPLGIALLFATVIGWLLAVVLLAAYLFGIALAGLLGLSALAEGIVRRGGPPETARVPARRLLVLGVLAAALILLRTVPFVGGFVSLVLVLLGLGMLGTLARSRGAVAT